MSSKVLLTALISSVVLSGCVKKDYVVMHGATPAMPKEQALAWCEDKVDSGADLKIEQARLNGALSDAMQPKTYTMNGFTNCNSIGSYTNCNSTGYATPMPSYNSGQYGQAMGAALGAAFARPGEIKKCMAMLGYSEVEVQQSNSRPTQSSVQSSSQAATQMRAINPLSAGSEASDVFNGWSIAKLDKVQGFTGCFAMNINSAQQGLPLSIMIEKGRYDKAILSVRHDGKASPNSDVGTVRLAALELKNLPMRSLTGSEALTPLDLTSEVRNALETRGLLSWDVNHQYAFVLPEAPNLIRRLIQCADASSFSTYLSMVSSDLNNSSSSAVGIDFVGGDDGLTNEQRYKLARQILEYKQENKVNVTNPNPILKKPEVTAPSYEFEGEWGLEIDCINFEGTATMRASSRNSDKVYYSLNYADNENNRSGSGYLNTEAGSIVNLNLASLIYYNFNVDSTRSKIIAKHSGRCTATFTR